MFPRPLMPPYAAARARAQTDVEAPSPPSPLIRGTVNYEAMDASCLSMIASRRRSRMLLGLACVAFCLCMCALASWSSDHTPIPRRESKVSNSLKVDDRPPTAMVLTEGASAADGSDGISIHASTPSPSPLEHPCSTLPNTRSRMHEWLQYESHASLSLMHSLAASLALLLLSPPPFRGSDPTAVSACALASQVQQVWLEDDEGERRMVEQRGLFFDSDAQAFWTKQRDAHSGHAKHQRHARSEPVWLRHLSAGDCLVCTPDSHCAGEVSALAQLRKTMRHAPEGWAMVHLHECQEGQANYTKHEEQEWKNECEEVCREAKKQASRKTDTRGEHKESLAWLSCSICQSMNAQVDAAADLELSAESTWEGSAATSSRNQTELWSSDDLALVDGMMSELFQSTTVPPTGMLWPTSAAVPLEGSARKNRRRSSKRELKSAFSVSRAFFLDWSSQLMGVSQLLHAALTEPESLRNLFADSHAFRAPGASSSASEPEHGADAATSFAHDGPVFAASQQRPFHRSSSVDQLYQLDQTFVQSHMDAILAALLPAKAAMTRSWSRTKLGGGGGGGMGLQLECIDRHALPDDVRRPPLLSIGGGGGGGFRSVHHLESEQTAGYTSSRFKGGAGGGAGLQSWEVISPQSNGITVGGGGGGGLHMNFSRQWRHSVEHEKAPVALHEHGASPDELISLPPAALSSSDPDHPILADFPSLLAFQMRKCMSVPSQRLVLVSSGGAGGGMDLRLDGQQQSGNGASSENETGQRTSSSSFISRSMHLFHSVNFRLQHEFTTCGWDRRVAPCAQLAPFPGRAPPPSASLATSLVARISKLAMEGRHEHRKGQTLEDEQEDEDEAVSPQVPPPSQGWTGEMQRRLTACLAVSRELSTELRDELTAISPLHPASTTLPTSDNDNPAATVSRRDAFHDLLCTCFLDALSASTTATSQHAGMMPAFCHELESAPADASQMHVRSGAGVQDAVSGEHLELEHMHRRHRCSHHVHDQVSTGESKR